MTNYFEKAIFNYGWKINSKIKLFNNEYKVTVVATAYSNNEKPTEEQNKAYGDFLKNQNEVLKKVENKIEYELCSKELFEQRYLPVRLKISEDGEIAILCEVKNDLQDSLVIVLRDEIELTNLDVYL